MTETYGPITKGYPLPAWDSLPDAERYALMARQGHGFLTSLPIRVVKPLGEDDDHHHAAEGGPSGRRELVDVARDGRELGEIVFLGNICAQGYYRNPEATRRLFAGGALHSGDLAVWHPDGSAQIQDRSKDIIISGAFLFLTLSLFFILSVLLVPAPPIPSPCRRRPPSTKKKSFFSNLP